MVGVLGLYAKLVPCGVTSVSSLSLSWGTRGGGSGITLSCGSYRVMIGGGVGLYAESACLLPRRIKRETHLCAALGKRPSDVRL